MEIRFENLTMNPNMIYNNLKKKKKKKTRHNLILTNQVKEKRKTLNS